MSKDKGKEVALQSITITDAPIPYLPDYVWITILKHIADPRCLTSFMRISKRFYRMLEQAELEWLDSLITIQAEYFRMVNTVGIGNVQAYSMPREARMFMKVAGYGKSVYAYHQEVERNKPREKTKIEKIIGTSSLTGVALLAGLLVLFYIFFILLGLTLDNAVAVPAWVFFLFAMFMCFIVMGITITMFLRQNSMRFLRTVIMCRSYTLITIFALTFIAMCIAIFVFAYLQTGNASTGIWVFCGIGYATLIILLFTFRCNSVGLGHRYGLAFRLFMGSSLTCFCLGIVMLVYTQHNSRQAGSFGWAFAAWVFSYLVMVFYLFFLGLCFGNGYQSPRGLWFCLFSTLEALSGALLFSTAAMCYLNVVRGDATAWVNTLIPIFPSSYVSLHSLLLLFQV